MERTETPYIHGILDEDRYERCPTAGEISENGTGSRFQLTRHVNPLDKFLQGPAKLRSSVPGRPPFVPTQGSGRQADPFFVETFTDLPS